MADSSVTSGGEDSPDEPDLVQGFRCGDCGGRLQQIAKGSSDTSLWREHKCVDCGGEGSYYNSHSPHTPHLTGVTERRANLSTDGGYRE